VRLNQHKIPLVKYISIHYARSKRSTSIFTVGALSKRFNSLRIIGMSLILGPFCCFCRCFLFHPFETDLQFCARVQPCTSFCQDPSRPVLIIGGGMSGITAAMRLHQAGCAVQVLEAKPQIGGIYHVSLSCYCCSYSPCARLGTLWIELVVLAIGCQVV
jgi:hypothetical protein